MISSKEWQGVLNGKTYVPVEEFTERPEGAILLQAGDAKKLRVYTSEEKLGGALIDLLLGKNYTIVEVEPKRNNI